MMHMIFREDSYRTRSIIPHSFFVRFVSSFEFFGHVMASLKSKPVYVWRRAAGRILHQADAYSKEHIL